MIVPYSPVALCVPPDPPPVDQFSAEAVGPDEGLPASWEEKFEATMWRIPFVVILIAAASMVDIGGFPPLWDVAVRIALHVLVPLFAVELIHIWWRPAWLRATRRHVRLPWVGMHFLLRIAATIGVVAAIAWRLGAFG